MELISKAHKIFANLSIKCLKIFKFLKPVKLSDL